MTGAASNIPASGAIERRRDRSAWRRRADANGLRLVSRAARRLELRYIASPAGRGAVRNLALRRERACAEPRRHFAAAGLVRARDHRPVRLALSRSPGAASAGAARRRPVEQTAVRSRYPRELPLRVDRRTRRSPTSPAPRPTSSCCRSARCAPTCVESGEFIFLYVGEAHPPLSAAAVLQASRHGEAFRGRRRRARRRTGRARLRRRQRGACARLLPGGRDGAPDCVVPVRAQCLARCCSPNWSGSTITSTISAISANTTTLKVGEAEGKLLEERAKQINARLTGSRFLRSLLVPGRIAARPRPRAAGSATNSKRLRDEFATLCRHARELRESSRPADHDRRAAARGGLRPGRDRADRSVPPGSTAICGAITPTPPMASCRSTVPMRDGGDAYARAAGPHGGSRTPASF